MAIEPGTYNMTIQRRSDHQVSLTLKDGDDAAINLTGYTIASQVWDFGRTAKAADVTCAITTANAGKWTWTLTDTQTTTFTADEYRYDVLLTNPSGVKEYWLEGIIYMDEGYTS